MKHRYQILEAVPRHARELAPVMRAADIEEVRDHGREPLDALMYSLENSREVFTGMADGRVVCMFGVGSASIVSRNGCPWLLGARELAAHAPAFLRLNQQYMEHLRRDYDLLWNFVSARNVVAIRWLIWLGFTVSGERADIPGALDWRRFELDNRHV